MQSSTYLRGYSCTACARSRVGVSRARYILGINSRVTQESQTSVCYVTFDICTVFMQRNDFSFQLCKNVIVAKIQPRLVSRFIVQRNMLGFLVDGHICCLMNRHTVTHGANLYFAQQQCGYVVHCVMYSYSYIVQSLPINNLLYFPFLN